MSENLYNISSEYDMMSMLKNIGIGIFGKDLSTQRLGLFGTIVEHESRIFGSTILDSSIRANEFNIITAKKRETLLCEASTIGLNIDNANPVTMSTYLIIDTKSIINNSVNGGYSTSVITTNVNKPTYILVLEKDANITIANYNFMFEHDIQITATYSEVTNEYIFSAKYLTTGDTDVTSFNGNYIYPTYNSVSNISDKYIQVYNVNDIINTNYANSLIMFKVGLKQMSKVIDYHTIIQNDEISLTGIDSFFNNMLSHFNVYYKEKNSTTWSYVKAVSIYDTQTYNEKIIKYEIFHDSGKIRFDFSKLYPEVNSEIKIEIYNTLGSEPNDLSYEGNGSDISVELNSYDDRHAYSGLEIGCKPIVTYSDGTNIPTLAELKSKLIMLRSSLNSINTDNDIYNYLISKDSTNSFRPVKKRSDLIDRNYSLFMMPKMRLGDTIPTSTLDYCIKKPESNQTITVKAGTPLILNKDVSTNTNYSDLYAAIKSKHTDDSDFYGDNTLVKLDILEPVSLIDASYKYADDEGNIIPQYVSALETSQKVFSMPYTMVYNTDTQISSFYISSINKSVNMSLAEENINSSVNFSIDHINIYRNLTSNVNSYKIIVSVIPNGTYSNAVLGNIINSGNVKDTIMLKGLIYKNSGNAVDGYFDFTYESYIDSLFKFSAVINVQDELSTTGCINMKNLYNTTNLELKNEDPESLIPFSTTNSSGSTSSYQYSPDGIDVNENYLNLNVSGFKIGIGCYYLSRPQTYLGDNFTSTGKVSTLLTDNNITHCATESISNRDTLYPMFINTCKYGTTDYDVKYILANAYDNSNDSINLYTDMSQYVKSVTTLYENGDDTFIFFEDIPVVQYSKIIDEQIGNRITDIIPSTKELLYDMVNKLPNNFGLDFKFFRTYGPCRYFKLEKVIVSDENDSINLNNLDIKTKFNVLIKNNINISDNDLINSIKNFIKSYIETINTTAEDYTIYISNVITELEKEFSSYVKSIELVSINDNINTYRILKYNKPNFDDSSISKEYIKEYVPEYINIPLENITITISR